MLRYNHRFAGGFFIFDKNHLPYLWIYPEFICNQDKYNFFIPIGLREYIEALIDNTGLVKEDYIQ